MASVRHALSVGILAAVVEIGLDAAVGDNGHAVWSGFEHEPAPFCEAERTTRLIRQFSNTVSDVGFLAVASLLFSDWLAVRSHKATLSSSIYEFHPSLILLNAAVNLLHFVGTTTNHACNCHLGHRLDLLGMWAVMSLCSLFGVLRLLDSRYSVGQSTGQSPLPRHVVPAFMTCYIVLLYGFWRASDAYYVHNSLDGIESQLSAVVLVPGALVNVWYLASKRDSTVPVGGLYAAMVFMVIGVVLNKLDAAKILCDPESPLQGHAVWHLITAGALVALHREHYMKEQWPKLNTRLMD